MGLLLFSVGMLGEYIGRINGLVRKRRRFRIAKVLQAKRDPDSPTRGSEPDRGPGPQTGRQT